MKRLSHMLAAYRAIWLTSTGRMRSISNILPIVVLAFLLTNSLGCRVYAPIYLWRPALVQTPDQATVALAPLSGPRQIAERIEQQMLAQRPATQADVALFTPDQLALRSPVRLASTAALSSDHTAIQAARAVGAELILRGEILGHHFQEEAFEEESLDTNSSQNMNDAFFSRLGRSNAAQQEEDEHLLLSWRVVDAESSRTLGTHIFTITTSDAAKNYPDLAALYPDDPTQLLLAASAREAWHAIAPVVDKEEVRLAVPYFQPGAWGVRRGVSAAKRGNWALAEERWQRVVERFGFQASAHHNLAVAYAAREDFPNAKQALLNARGPLALRLPGETLFWLDKNHRTYHEAHGIPTPIDGWAFPSPEEQQVLLDAPPRPLEDLPWWTAIPFTPVPK